ncbi:MAG: helix-turn-helix domain-containing protein [Chloroflexota bacterium]
MQLPVAPVSKTLYNLERHGKIGLVRAENGRSVVGFRLLATPEPVQAPLPSVLLEGLTAATLAELLSREILDADDAAEFLGIARNSLEYAAQRSRIAYVQYGAKKLFTRADLLDYRRRRGHGRNSRLGPAPHWVVKP